MSKMADIKKLEDKQQKPPGEGEPKQILILVNSKDKQIGFATREECHLGKGKRHRAIMVFLIKKGRKESNNKNRKTKEEDRHNNREILLQLRGENKLGGGRWDCSATTHVLKGEDFKGAAKRCLKNELGIQRPPSVTTVGSFNYTDEYDGGKNSENEHCAVALGKYSGKVKINQNEATETKYVMIKDILTDVKRNPKTYTKWCRLGLITAFRGAKKRRKSKN